MLNRNSPEDYTLDLSSVTKAKIQDDYVMLRYGDNDKVLGVWINDTERAGLLESVKRIMATTINDKSSNSNSSSSSVPITPCSSSKEIDAEAAKQLLGFLKKAIPISDLPTPPPSPSQTPQAGDGAKKLLSLLGGGLKSPNLSSGPRPDLSSSSSENSETLLNVGQKGLPEVANVLKSEKLISFPNHSASSTPSAAPPISTPTTTNTTNKSNNNNDAKKLLTFLNNNNNNNNSKNSIDNMSSDGVAPFPTDKEISAKAIAISQQQQQVLLTSQQQMQQQQQHLALQQQQTLQHQYALQQQQALQHQELALRQMATSPNSGLSVLDKLAALEKKSASNVAHSNMSVLDKLASVSIRVKNCSNSVVPSADASTSLLSPSEYMKRL